MSEIFIQSVGFVALGLTLLVYQTNSRRSMLNLQFASCALYVVHFFLLGAYTGAALNVVGGIRSYVFNRDLGHRLRVAVPIFFMALFAVAGAVTWQGYVSLLPVLASFGGTLAFWQKNPRTIRLISLISPPLWLAYNILVGSYAGVLSEILLLGSTFVGVYRFDMRPRVAKNPN